MVIAVIPLAGCGSTAKVASPCGYPHVGKSAIRGGPAVKVWGVNETGLALGKLLIRRLPLKASWTRGLKGYELHYLGNDLAQHYTTVFVKVRVLPGKENPVARLEGYGRGFCFKSGVYA